MLLRWFPDRFAASFLPCFQPRNLNQSPQHRIGLEPASGLERPYVEANLVPMTKWSRIPRAASHSPMIVSLSSF
jgi:hypothetical protein